MPIDETDSSFLKSIEDKQQQDALNWLDQSAKQIQAEREAAAKPVEEEPESLLMQAFRPVMNIGLEIPATFMGAGGEFFGDIAKIEAELGKTIPGLYNKEAKAKLAAAKTPEEQQALIAPLMTASAELGAQQQQFFQQYIKNEGIPERVLGRFAGGIIPGVVAFAAGVPFAVGKGWTDDGLRGAIKEGIIRYGTGKFFSFIHNLYVDRVALQKAYPGMGDIGSRVKRMTALALFSAAETKARGGDILSEEGIQSLAGLVPWGWSGQRAYPGARDIKPGEAFKGAFRSESSFLGSIFGEGTKPIPEVQAAMFKAVAEDIPHNLEKTMPEPKPGAAEGIPGMPSRIVEYPMPEPKPGIGEAPGGAIGEIPIPDVNQWSVEQIKSDVPDSQTKWKFNIPENLMQGLPSVIDQIRSTEPQKTVRVLRGPLEPGGTDTFIINPGLPEALTNKKFTSDKIINAIEKAMKGEELGIDQARMVESALEQAKLEINAGNIYELNAPYEIVQKVNAADSSIKALQFYGNGWDISKEIFKAIEDITTPKPAFIDQNISDMKIQALKTFFKNENSEQVAACLEDYAISAKLDSQGRALETPDRSFVRCFIETQEPTTGTEGYRGLKEEPIDYRTRTGERYPDNFTGLASDIVGETGVQEGWDGKMYAVLEKGQEPSIVHLNEDVAYQEYKALKDTGKEVEIQEIAVRKGVELVMDPEGANFIVKPKDAWIVKEGKNSLTNRQKLAADLTVKNEVLEKVEPFVPDQVSTPAARSGVVDLGRWIAREFKAVGFVSFKGLKLASTEALAVIGQVIRDPRYEHFFLVYAKNGVAVSHEHVTSRMPGKSAIFSISKKQKVYEKTKEFQNLSAAAKQESRQKDLKIQQAKFYQKIRDRITRLGADSVYGLHNHPGGKADPSPEDVNTTMLMAEAIPEFKGHTIVNSGEFGQITRKGLPTTQTVPGLPENWVDPLFEKQSLAHEFLGNVIRSVDDIRQIGKRLTTDENMVIVAYTNSQGELMLLQKAPINLVQRIKDFENWVRGEQRASGSPRTLVYFNEHNIDVMDSLKPLLDNKTITGTVSETTYKIAPKKSPIFQKALPIYQVAETKYDFVPEPDNLSRPLIEVKKDLDKFKDFWAKKIEEMYSTKVDPNEAEAYLGKELDKVININMGKINSEGDILTYFKQVSANFPDMMDYFKRYTQTWNNSYSAARRLGITEEQFLKANPGTVYNPEQLAAMGMLLDQMTRKTLTMRDKILNGDANDKELYDFMVGVNKQIGMQARFRGSKADTARTMNIMKTMATVKQLDFDKTIMDGLDVSGGREMAIELANRLKGLDTMSQAQAMIREAAKATKWDMFFESFIHGLLYNPRTWATNPIATVFNQFYTIPVRYMGAAVSGIAGTEGGISLTEANAYAYGICKGYREGLSNALTAWKTGVSKFGQQKYQHRPALTSTNVGLTGKKTEIASEILGFDVAIAFDFLADYVHRLPGRMLLVGDELTRSASYRMELNAQAVREAYKRGTQPGNMDRVVDDLKMNPTELMEGKSRDYADILNWTNKLGKYGQKIQGLRQIPGIRYLMPFLNVYTNLTKYEAHQTPLGLLARSTRAKLRGESGPAERDLEIAKMTFGSLFMLAMGEMAAAGFINGGCPYSDKDKKRLWMEKNGQEYCFNIGGQHLSINKIEPVGGLIAFAADGAQTIAMLQNDADIGDVAAFMALSFKNQITNKSYLTGINNVFKAYDDPTRNARNWINRFVTSLTPGYSGLKAVERQFSPEVEEARTLLDTYRAMIPGASKNVPPLTNSWGEDVIAEISWYDMINPFMHSTVKSAPVNDEILRLDFGISKPQRSISGVDLKPWEYYRYCKLAGNELKGTNNLGCLDRLKEIINSPEYKRESDGPEGGKARIIRETIQSYRQAAQEALMQEAPLLRSAVEDMEREKRKKLMPTF